MRTEGIPTEPVYSIFTPEHTPTVTYVNREPGKYEEKIERLLKRGSIAFIHGPSKYGKSVLCETFAQKWGDRLHRMNCKNFSSLAAFFVQLAAELRIPIDREEQYTTEKSRGINWVASIKASILGLGEAGIEGGASATTTKTEGATSRLNQDIPGTIGRMKHVLILDNFHYVKDKSIQREILQEIRDLSERDRLGVIIIAITDDPNYLQGISGELVNRCGAVTVERWSPSDLQQIPSKGFAKLNVGNNSFINQLLMEECFGSPAIMQEICLQLALHLGISQPSRSARQIEFGAIRSDLPRIFKNATEDTVTMFTPYQTLMEYVNDLATRTPVRLRTHPARNIDEDRRVSLHEAVVQIIAGHDNKGEKTVAEIKHLSGEYVIDSLGDVDDRHWLRVMEDLDTAGSLILDQENIRNMVEANVFKWNPRRRSISIANPYFAFYTRWSGHIVGID